MEDFRFGDFIRLKDAARWNTARVFNKNINVFEIIEVDDRYVKIKDSKDLISLKEIEPIPIDGFSDKHIYYDPIIAANIVEEGREIHTRQKIKPYYYDKFCRCFYQSKNLQELIKERQCNYVHEVQHFLYDQFQDRGLKINIL